MGVDKGMCWQFVSFVGLVSQNVLIKLNRRLGFIKPYLNFLCKIER